MNQDAVPSMEELEQRGHRVGGFLLLILHPIIRREEEAYAVVGKFRPDRIDGWWPSPAPGAVEEGTRGTVLLLASGATVLIAEQLPEFEAQLQVIRAAIENFKRRQQLAPLGVVR